MRMRYEIGSRILADRLDRLLQLGGNGFGSTGKKITSVKTACRKNRCQQQPGVELGAGIEPPGCRYSGCHLRALDVSPSLLLGIQVTGDELTEQERKVLKAYREKEDVRQAVHILLGVSEE